MRRRAHFSSLLLRPVERVIEYCQKKGLPLIVGCDANAHHAIWGSTDTNDRSRRLLEYLVLPPGDSEHGE